MDVQYIFRSRSGYSLIEVLVALLVLSIGMLGVGGMMLGSLKDTRGAYNRTKAIALAWDMVERIRANAAAGNAYEADEGAVGADGGCFATHANNAPQTCLPDVLAAHDIFTWKNALVDKERGLPEGKGSIDHDDTTEPATYTITVEWTEGVTPSGENAVQSVTVATQL